MNSRLNTKSIKNCYDITKIRAEYQRVNNNRDIKIRRIDDTLNHYTMILMRMNDCERKRTMELKINELKDKLNKIRGGSAPPRHIQMGF